LILTINISQVRSGQAFNNCLIDQNKIVYNNLLNYPFVETSVIFKICCNTTQCYPSTSLTTGCNSMDTGIMCKKIAQPVFCHLDLCGGIVGDTQITGNTTFGDCPFENLSVAINHLSTISYVNMIGLDKGYAHFTCPKNTACQDYMYNWDNGGWTFSNNYISIYRDSYNITNKCYLQWPASFPSNTTTSIQGIIPTTTTSGNSITTTISDSNNSKLIVGAIVGSVIFLVIVEIAIIVTLKIINRNKTLIIP
ncbi:21739_t:CDS:1, partial [Cetraspora pellucida]